jgi:hypothetical protein
MYVQWQGQTMLRRGGQTKQLEMLVTMLPNVNTDSHRS